MSEGLMVAIGQILGAQQPYSAAEENAKTVTVAFFDAPPRVFRVSEHSRNFDNISFRGERHARMHLEAMADRIARVRASVARDSEEAAPENVAAARAAFDQWAAKHIGLSLAHIRRHASMASPMITGPSNFPVRRQQKLQRWADNAEARIHQHADIAAKRLKRLLWPHGAPGEAIRSNNPEAVELLRAKVAELTAKQERMKALNAAWRKAGKPGKNSEDATWQAFGDAAQLSAGELALRRRELCSHYMADRRPVAPVETWQLSNNLATIKTAQTRLANLEALQSRGDVERTQETAAGAVRIVEDVEAARIQLIFPGKPSAEHRAVLKRNGFRWAPTAGAWQRHLTNAGRYHAKAVLEEIANAVTT